MSEPLIQFHQVEKSFGAVKALNGLTFSVPAVGCLGLLGPNGSGKTTAIKCLLGLTRVDRGTITNRAKRIGYLPQQPALFNWMTAEEYLDFIGAAVGVSPTTRREAARHWLDALGLDQARRRRVGGFSGGMKQRLGIAAALIQDPDVVVLDEPVSALDPIGRHEILVQLDRLKRERSVIMSTHILDDAERVSDHVVIMREGEAIHSADMDQLRREISPHFDVDLALEPDEVEAFAERLRGEPWVDWCSVDGARLRVAVSDGDGAPLLARLGAEALPVVRFEKGNASLEDLFLRVVSKR